MWYFCDTFWKLKISSNRKKNIRQTQIQKQFIKYLTSILKTVKAMEGEK